jgi:hypothetical protein
MAERLDSPFVVPSNFIIHEVPTVPPGARIAAAVPRLAPPTLGGLAGLAGTFAGNGFNTIFRPQNPATLTPLPIPVPASDNVLELNLTSETLSFSSGLGSIPNRGSLQGDIFLNGVPYIQSIIDVTNPGQSTGIHFEPGIWLIVPETIAPAEGVTVARMASIPHGTSIEAQGIAVTSAGPPNIRAVDITPTKISDGTKIRFSSQTAENQQTARIPQDLAPFMLHGTITQALLDDPNSLLRAQMAGQTILSTTTLIVRTDPTAPLFGGGTDNIAFLLGDSAAANPNAQAFGDILDRNRAGYPANSDLRSRTGADHSRAGRPEAVRASRSKISSRSSSSCAGTADAYRDLDADPIYPDREFELQRLVLAARLGRHIGSGRSCYDTGIRLELNNTWETRRSDAASVGGLVLVNRSVSLAPFRPLPAKGAGRG